MAEVEKSQLIDINGLSVFKTKMDETVDAKIAEAGTGVTYTLSKNASGEIVLTGSDESETKVTDANTTYGFSQSGTTLTITPSEGDPITINMGEEITSEKIVAALGFTPADSEDVTGITNQLTADDNLVFDFTSDEEGNYGYKDAEGNFVAFGTGGEIESITSDKVLMDEEGLTLAESEVEITYAEYKAMETAGTLNPKTKYIVPDYNEGIAYGGTYLRIVNGKVYATTEVNIGTDIEIAEDGSIYVVTKEG